MQVNHNNRFVKKLMIGLLASGFGSLVALPSVAAPAAPSATGEITEALPLAEPLADPLAQPSVDELETTPVAEDEMLEAAPVAEDEVLETAPVAEDEMLETAPMAEDSMTETAPVAEDTIDTSEFTIAELTGSSASFQTLAAALEAADLTETLSGEGPYTVFAPTDEAFAALPEGAIEQLLLPENRDILVQILTYHVVSGAVYSTDLETGSVETVEGSDLAVEVGDMVTVNNANVIVADIDASNGVIHIIDRVILPPAPEASTETEPSAVAPVQ